MVRIFRVESILFVLDSLEGKLLHEDSRLVRQPTKGDKVKLSGFEPSYIVDDVFFFVHMRKPSSQCVRQPKSSVVVVLKEFIENDC